MADGIVVSILAIAGTFALLWYQQKVIARTGSVAIKTDNVHYKSDLLLNGSVIVALAARPGVRDSRRRRRVRHRHRLVAGVGRVARFVARRSTS